MWTARNAFGALWPCQHPLVLLGAAVLWLALGSVEQALARAAYGNVQSAAERRAWSQIKQAKVADFDQHCGMPRLDPKNEEDKR
jgi:hypothetical protein